MREGWHIQRFGEICALKKGRKPKLINTEEINAKPYLVAKYLRGAEPTDFAFVADKDSITVTADEIIIICDGSNSGGTFIGFDGVLSSTMAKIVHGNNIENRFLIYFLEFMFEKFNSSKTGSAIPHLDLNALRNQELPLPSLPEQRRIVAILDEAFEGIATAKANAEKNLQNAREVFESHLNAVFSQRGEGWVEKRIDEICNIKHGFAFKGQFFSDNGEYVLLTPGNFYESGGYRDRGEKQKYYVSDFPREYLLKKGDLLLAMTEQAVGLLGSPILVPDSNRFLHNQRLGLVEHRTTGKFSNEFLFYLFNSNAVRLAINSSASGVKVRHTSPKKIGVIQVFVPGSIAAQSRIAETLYELNRESQHLESLYQQKQTALDELKQSLLHQAFNGDL